MEAIKDAGGEDSDTVTGLRDSYYLSKEVVTGENGQKTIVENKVAFNDLSDAQISTLRPEDLRTADGKKLNEKQKALFYNYRQFNDAQVADKISIMAGQVFGQDFNDWWSRGINTNDSDWLLQDGTTYMGDAESQKWGRMAGQVGASILGFQVASGMAATALTGAAVRGSVSAANALKATKFAKNVQTVYGPMLNSMAATVGQSGVYGVSFWTQYYELRAQGIMSGLSLSEANKMAFIGGLMEAGWEAWGFGSMKKFLTTKPSFVNLIFKDVIPEGSQEALQTLSENAVTMHFGMNSSTFSDIVSEIALSFAAGGIAGSVIGAAHWRLARYAYATEGIQAREESARKDIADKYKDLDKVENPFSSSSNAYERTKEEIEAIDYKPETTENKVVEEGQLLPESKISEEPADKTASEVDESDKRIKNADEAQEMANLDQKVMDQYKEVYYQMAKSVNKNITQKQLDNGWKAVMRVMQHEAKTGDITSTMQASAEKYLSALKFADESAQKNIKELQEKLKGVKGVEINTSALLSTNADERYEAQWDVTQALIRQDFEMNGSPETGKIVASVFRNIFEETVLLSPDITPMDLYNAFKPTITSFRRAQINKQKINGADSFLDKVADRTISTDPVDAKEAASTLLQNYNSFKETGDKEYANKVQAELFQSVDPKRDVSQIMQAYEKMAVEEQAIAREMGVAWGNNLTQTDYILMAIMRSQGYNQKDISDAWNLNQKEANKSYKEAVAKLFPALTKQEISSMEDMIAGNEGYNVKGAYVTARPQEEMESNEQAIFLFENSTEKTSMEEAAHWIYDILDRLGNSATVPTGFGLNADIPIIRLKNAIDKNIRLRRGNNSKITARMVQETFADFVNDYMKDSSDENVSPEMRDAFEAVMAEYDNKITDIHEDSMKGEMTTQAKKGLSAAVGNLFKPSNAGNRLSIAKNLEINASNAKNKEEVVTLTLEAIAAADLPGEINFAMQLVEEAKKDSFDYVDALSIAMQVANMQRQMALNQLLGSFLIEKDGKYDFNDDAEVKVFNSDRHNFTQEDGIFYSREKTEVARENTDARQGKSLQEKAKETAKQLSAKSAVSAMNDFTETLVHAAAKTHPALANIIQRGAYDLTKRLMFAESLHSHMSNLVKDHNTNAKEKGIGEVITQGEWDEFALSLFNNHRKEAREKFIGFFIEGKEREQALKLFNTATSAIDQVHKELSALGVKINKINGYWPSIVGKPEEFNLMLWQTTGMRGPKPEAGSEIGKLVRRMSNQGKSVEDIIDAVGSLMQRNPADKEVAAFHERIIKTKTIDMIPYYKDPLDSLLIYLKSASRTIFTRQMFGELQTDENGNTIWGQTGLVPSFLVMARKHSADFEKKFGKLNTENEQNFLNRIRQYMKRDASDQDIWEGLRAIQGITTLGNITSSVNQILELAPAMLQFNMGNVLEAIKRVITKSNVMDIEIANIQTLNESIRLDKEGVLKELQEDLFKATGFSKMDIFTKNVVLEAALIHAQGSLANWNSENPSISQQRFERYFDESFPPSLYSEERRNQIKKDILAGNITDDVSFFCRNALARTQPIDSTEIAAGYNSAGTYGRACYYLTTVSLKQIEFLVDDFRKNLKAGKARAAKEFVKFILFAIMIGIPAEVIKSFLSLKKPDIKSAIIFSPAQYALINEYYWNVAKDRGIFSATMQIMVPGSRLIDDVWKDIVYSGELGIRGRTHFLNSLPIIGKQLYNSLGGGREQLKKRKENIEYTFDDNIDFFGGELF